MIIVTNPENENLLNQLRDTNSAEHGIGPHIPELSAHSVRFDPCMPARDIEYNWEPPEGDRFTEYGPEDEAWMRPLNLGTLHPVDKGPLFYMINDIKFRTHFDYGASLVDHRSVITSTFI